MVGIVMGMIVAVCVLSILWGFIILMTGLCLEARRDVVLGSAMVLIPFIAGCIYVGVAL